MYIYRVPIFCQISDVSPLIWILNFKQYFKHCEKQRDMTANNFQVGFLLAQFGAFYTFRIKGDLMVFSNYRNWIEFKTVWICYRNFRRNVKTQMLSKYTKKARFRHYLFQKLLYTKRFKEVDKLLRNFFLLECWNMLYKSNNAIIHGFYFIWFINPRSPNTLELPHLFKIK